MSDIKLFCCDIDGTLVRDDKTLSEENRFWINRLVKEKGVNFSIVSGRTRLSVSRYYRELGVKGATSALNGAALYDEKDNLISSVLIPKEITKTILPVFKASGLEFILVILDDWYTEKKSGYIYENKRRIYGCDSFLCGFDELADEKEISKFLMLSKDQKALDEVEAEVRRLYDENSVTYFPGNGFLEIMPANVSKGRGVEALASYYGLVTDEVMAIGDDYNDISMLERAGVGAAMGNALEEVKKSADIITASNEENGVARIIEEYFF